MMDSPPDVIDKVEKALENSSGMDYEEIIKWCK